MFHVVNAASGEIWSKHAEYDEAETSAKSYAKDENDAFYLYEVRATVKPVYEIQVFAGEV